MNMNVYEIYLPITDIIILKLYSLTVSHISPEFLKTKKYMNFFIMNTDETMDSGKEKPR